MICAQALPIGLVPKLGHVLLMRDDMIYVRSLRAAADAVGLSFQPFLARGLPLAVIAARAAIGAGLIKPRLALSIRAPLASAALPELDNLATLTNAGRAAGH